MRKIGFLAAGIIALFLVAGSTVALAGSSRIVARGKISVYKGGKLFDKLSGLNPVTEDALLVCDGNCLIKAPGVSLAGTDETQLAVKNGQEQFSLLVHQGQVDFVVTDRIGKMAFYTPNGQYTVADVVFDAGTDTTVRGYMQVADDGSARIGVYEGRMVFSTVEGAKLVDSNNYILLARAEVGAAGGVGAGATAGLFGLSSLIAGGTVVAIAIAVVVVNNNDDGGSARASAFASASSSSNGGSGGSGKNKKTKKRKKTKKTKKIKYNGSKGSCKVCPPPPCCPPPPPCPSPSA